MKNTVKIIGNVGSAPVVRELQGGNLVARFNVATNEKIKTENGVVTKTNWHSAVAWGELADYVRKNVDKGTHVALEGKLVTNSWTDRDGNNRTNTEIKINEILIQGAKTLKPVQDQF